MKTIIIGLVLISVNLIPSTTTYVREEVKQDFQVVKAEVSAYTSSVDETNEDPFTTALGKRTGPGIIACPSKLEFGTKVEIEGVEYVCEDRMNKRYRDKNNFDIWMTEKHLAYEFGRQQLEVKIIKD